MKKIFVFPSLLLLLGVGCLPTTNLADESDFNPIQGKATAPEGEDGASEGPYERRIMTAISYDGLTFTQNDRWVCDQCHAPDAVVKDGIIYLYYTGWIVGERLNTSAIAISGDQGQTWTYKYLELTNRDTIDRVVYPDVVLLQDGTFRLFFTAGQPSAIHYADSPDGITFEYKGLIFAQQEDIATDSTTMKIADTWHLYALSEDGIHRIWHLTSPDALSFTVYDLLSFPNAGVLSMPFNGHWLEDRFYLFMSDPDGAIGSMWSKNGFDWYPNGETNLEPMEDEAYVIDPAVVDLGDGRYLMYYVTNIP